MTLNLSPNACMTLNLTLNYTKFSSLPLLHALTLTSAEHDYQLRTTISAAMSCASPISQPSPTLHMLTANLIAANCRPNLDDQDLILHNNTFSFAFTTPPTPHLPSSLSSSPAQLRPALTDLLHAKHINSPQSALNKGAVNLPCSPSFESPRKGCKENRININGDGEDNGGSITSVASSAGVSPYLKRKRPAKLAIPECARLASFGRQKEFELPEQETYSSEIHSYEVPLFGVSSKKGRRNCMEDAQTATTDFLGKPNQAFFGVFDGHGGKDAAKFAAENLGHRVAMAIQNQKGGKESLKTAMHAGYMALDSDFLAKNVSSGACSVSAFVREGQLVVANAGDCKAVLCRDGKAEALTTLHRASNAEERERIENLGGYVDCFNGVWRLQGTLAVTRGFGDMNLKQWVSAEPEVRQLDITHDCEFLILATDGLWDTVSDQEAVDCAREVLHDLIEKEKCLDPSTARPCKAQKHHHSSFPSGQNNEDNQESSSSKTNACNKLIHKACKRGNLDDITVMIVLLQGFSIA